MHLTSLTSLNGLTLPHTVNGDLYLPRLKSLEGVKLPETIGGDLYLSSLTLKDVNVELLPVDFNGLVFLEDGSHALRRSVEVSSEQ